jgi:hypothetical protein
MPLIQPYVTYGDVSAQWTDSRINQFPGYISRMEPATGLLVRGVLVNGHYLLCDSCDLYPKQDMKMETFVQGGPKQSIANIGKKWVDGKIICPVRVGENYVLDDAIRDILTNAQYPNSTIKLDTNHSLAHLNLTSKYPGTSNNQLVTFDTLIVKDLTLKATPTEGVKLEVSFIGMIEERRASYLVSPPDGHILGRALGWGDCTASRHESALRSVSSLQVYIKNQESLHVFLNPAGTPVENRSDNTQIMGVKSVDWGGSYVEVLRRGVETDTYIHGGWMVNENLVMEFGPIFARIPVPLFKPAEQPLTPKLFLRTSSFWTQSRPNISSSQDLLFFFDSLPSSESTYPPIYSETVDIITTLVP